MQTAKYLLLGYSQIALWVIHFIYSNSFDFHYLFQFYPNYISIHLRFGGRICFDKFCLNANNIYNNHLIKNIWRVQMQNSLNATFVKNKLMIVTECFRQILYVQILLHQIRLIPPSGHLETPVYWQNLLRVWKKR